MTKSLLKVSTLIIVMVAVLLTGCSSKEKEVVNVFAAASLTEVVNDWVEDFEKSHENLDVVVSFAGTNTLKLQIEQGAQADIFLSANQKYYDELKEKDFVEQGRCFAQNMLCLITHKENDKVTGLEDLIKEEVTIVLGDLEVPVGKYSDRVIENASQMIDSSFGDLCRENVVSYESNVKRIVAKIALNEVDAGLVYVTDALTEENVVMLPIEESINVTSHYYLALIKDSKHQKNAKEFYDYISSEKGVELLEKYGFVSVSEEN